ncbi:MAG: four helix bundle protein [Clostridiales bacterium]|nr:four helix bundle protein [Clostridiales bacterium]
MTESILRTKSKQFAKEIVFVCQEIKQNKKESNLSNQLVRSGTSIGANIYEANYAQGKRDFISKLEIALKECYESEYWLELLFETNYLCESDFLKLRGECGNIRRLLIASCKTAKENNTK